MQIVTIPNFLLFSAFLYYAFSGPKSCMTLLLIQRIREFFLSKNETKQENVVLEIVEKPVAKFEDKYIERVKTMEVKELSNERLAELKNSFVVENTSQGNVIMYWDNDRSTFAYYADHVIPYRFLEVVGRKYVIMNDCRKLFVDMEEEIKTAEQKLEDKKLEKERLAEEEEKAKQKKVDFQLPKKDVFAKMKSYNRDTSIKSVMTDPKKGSMPPKNTAVNTKQSEDVVLKENANRYSYQGKMANFSFLKKVDRRVVDKNYAMTFAEFKKMKAENKS